MARVGIIGAGIAGVAASLALRRAGVETDVFEAAPSIRKGGGALLLWSNGVRALQELTGSSDIHAIGTPLTGAEFRNWAGELLWRLPVAHMSAEARAPTLVVPRGDLLDALVRAHGMDHIWLGRALETLRQDAERVSVSFADGDTRTYDGLLGADGIHSTVRRQLGADVTLRSGRQDVWVGLAHSTPRGLDVGLGIATLGDGSRFCVVPLIDGRAYWYATMTHEGGRAARVVDHSSLIDAFSTSRSVAGAVLDRTSPADVIRTAIADRVPDRAWAHGRVGLIGDAAHASTPDLGQGACQALEDAVTIGDLAGLDADITQMWSTFEARRMPRATRVTRLSWAVTHFSAQPSPLVSALRDFWLRTAFRPLASAELAWILSGRPA